MKSEKTSLGLSVLLLAGLVIMLMSSCSESPFKPTEPVQSDQEIIDSLTIELERTRLTRDRNRNFVRCYQRWHRENIQEIPCECLGGV